MTVSADERAPLDSLGGVRRVLLVGMAGAGKSTVGRILAERLGWGYVDTDESVVERTGQSIPALFRDEGEPVFRAHEHDALRSVLARSAPVVVSLGGGAVLDPRNREMVRQAGTVVWLRAELPTLTERLGDAEDRPVVAREGRDPAGLGRLVAERRPHYAEVAKIVVDVDGMTPDEVAEAVLASLERCSR